MLALPMIARAGSQKFDCVSKGKAIKFNVEDEEAELTYVEKKSGQKTVVKRHLAFLPDYDNPPRAGEKLLKASPKGKRKELRKKEGHLHIVHKDGTSCDGREFWDRKFVQKYVLTGDELEIDGKTLEGQSNDETVVEMTCHDEGVTSPGGCFPDDGDRVIRIRDK